MVQVKDIGWGSYRDYSGPYHMGRSTPYKLPANPSNDDCVVATISATEGGSYSAANLYDRMIISVGLIQYGEAGQYSVSDMLGVVAKKDDDLLDLLKPALAQSHATFKTNEKNRYRFFLPGGEVDTITEQQQLFLQCDGHKDSWNDSSKLYAKTWAACVASVFEQPDAQVAQVSYIAPRLKGFAMKEAATLLFDGQPDSGWVGGLRAGFLSFAANLPAVASKHLLVAAGASSAPKWSEDWCIGILKQLTFGPGISIYPGRYNKIRPVIEKLYGINLPDFAEELRVWQAHQDEGMDAPSASEPTFMNVGEVQELLIHLGYDLGPSGADGTSGPKTKEAISMYQTARGLDPDGVVGKLTRKDMLEMYRSLPLK